MVAIVGGEAQRGKIKVFLAPLPEAIPQEDFDQAVQVPVNGNARLTT